MIDISILTIVYKPANITGGPPPCLGLNPSATPPCPPSPAVASLRRIAESWRLPRRRTGTLQVPGETSKEIC